MSTTSNEYQKAYKQAHRKEHAEYMKKYVAKSTSIACPCGGRYKSYCAYRHNMTDKHLAFLQMMRLQAELAKKEEIVVAPVVAPAPIDEIDLNTIDVKQIASLEVITLKTKEEKDMTEYVKAIDALLYPLPPVEKPKRKLRINKDKVLTCNPEQINFVV